MRFVYATFAFLIWAVFMTFMTQAQGVSVDVLCLSLAIVVAGALAGGDEND